MMIEPFLDPELLRRDRGAVELDLVGFRRRLDVVGEADLGNDEAVLPGELAPHLGDARGHLVARQDQRGVQFLRQHELDLERLELLPDRGAVLRLRLRVLRRLARRGLGAVARQAPRNGDADEGHEAAEQGEGQERQPGNDAQHGHQQRGEKEGVRIAGELVDDRLVGRAASAALGDEQAGGERDDERRDLGDEAIADRELGEDVGG